MVSYLKNTEVNMIESNMNQNNKTIIIENIIRKLYERELIAFRIVIGRILDNMSENNFLFRGAQFGYGYPEHDSRSIGPLPAKYKQDFIIELEKYKLKISGQNKIKWALADICGKCQTHNMVKILLPQDLIQYAGFSVKEIQHLTVEEEDVCRSLKLFCQEREIIIKAELLKKDMFL